MTSGTEQGSSLAQQIFTDLAKTVLANTAMIQGLMSEIRMLREEIRSFGREGFKEIPEMVVACVEGVEAIVASQNVMLTILQQVAERGSEVNSVTWADVASIMGEIRDQMESAGGEGEGGDEETEQVEENDVNR